MSKKVLFVGPYPPIFTGQSIAFKEIVDNYPHEKIILNTSKYGKIRIANFCYTIFILPIIFLIRKFDRVYFTCSRTKVGFIKDLQLLLLTTLTSKKVINHLHGADFKTFYDNAGILKPAVRWCYRKITTNIVLIPAMNEQFSQISNVKTVVVPNCYSAEYESEEIDLWGNKKQVLYLSNLMTSKGILIFIEAAAKLLEKSPGTLIQIAGVPMADHQHSEKEITTLFTQKFQCIKQKYPEQVFYHGRVHGEIKKNLLRDSDIFVLPTFYKTEAFPISIIEAMRFGNAIITTRHNYLPEIISDQNGRLVTPECSQELAEALEELFKNHDALREIQSYNIKLAKEKYNPTEYCQNITRILEKSI